MTMTTKQHFNPRSPHGERLAEHWTYTEGAAQFQSTLPARGATCAGKSRDFPTKISIHAPRTGSDDADALIVRENPYFNPRSPHGERHPCFRKTGNG